MDTIAEPEFITIMRDRLAALKDNRQALADEIGVSRTTVSLVLADKYLASTDAVQAKVMARYTDRVACPHLDKSISQTACEKFAKRSMPISNPPALRHWTACQSCQLNTFEEASNA